MSLESGTLCAYVCVCVCYMCVYMCICVCVCVWFVCFNRISDSLLSLCNSQPGTHQHLVRGPCMHTHIHTVHEHVRAHTHGSRACTRTYTRFTSMWVPTLDFTGAETAPDLPLYSSQPNMHQLCRRVPQNHAHVRTNTLTCTGTKTALATR
jgi:hypothetical protein